MAVLVNKPAPDFQATAVVNGQFKEDFKLSDLQGKYVILFFYPLSFTFVCPTELHAFQESYEAFKALNVELVGISVDSHYTQLAWLETPKSKGGIEGIQYPLVADLTKQIASDYDVLLADQGIALRGLFLIDKEGVVQHQVVNNLPLGRSVNEAMRMVEALQYFEENGEVCPANWQKGDKAMRPDQEGLADFFK
jgi:peroxiredoxin (alkyl hydroperoxide reductase subunit C)